MGKTVTDRELVLEAIEARKAAYAPYSNYMVGAALLTKDGKIYRGCNIESAAYSPTNCAERTAFFKAVSEGEREFEAIAVIGAHRDAKEEDYGYFYPCGVCRQVMMEFCNPKRFRILTAKNADDFTSFLLEEILPHGFGPSDLNY
ncbi:Cytidine deaminase [bioreactor metagenome]|uniref:cytidine deaminase n=1 Tax=bioreactor metagenome TaxID=1076179 RepID=A0A645DDY6_9ZZZZ|nr:cytidine deaminase [Candidatus Metalachnospira sp.]